MAEQPSLLTRRLTLRPSRPSDSSDGQKLAGEGEIADTTANIPHPYRDGLAEEWIASHDERFRSGESVVFAITNSASGDLRGAIGLEIVAQEMSAEMGYWIGRPFWNHGVCTEAAREVLRYGFEELGLVRIQARHFVRNPSSCRVMNKIGMTVEGRLPVPFLKWGKPETIEMHAILKQEFVP